MTSTSDLPAIREKKKITKSRFEDLAKKVKRYLEEEEEYLERKRRKNETSNSTGLSASY